MLTLGEIAAHLDLRLGGGGDPDLSLTGIAPLERATPSELSFIADRRYLAALKTTSAACVITREEWSRDCPVPVLCTSDPYLAYARVSELFDPESRPVPGIHPMAYVHESAVVPASASIGPNACVEAGAQLGEDVCVSAGAFVGRNARLGARTWLAANVTIYHGVVLGTDCQIHAATVIGSDGFGFARHSSGWQRIAQLGTVRVGDRVSVGSSVSIDRGTLDDTVIGDDVIIDNQVHIAHNCVVGKRTAIAGCTGFAGSTIVGEDCTFAGQVGVSGHLEICDNVHLTGQARVTGPITKEGTYASGTGLETLRDWRKSAIRFRKLDDIAKRLEALEKRLPDRAE